MRNIFIGNLDFNTTEDQLRALFAAHGAVETVTIEARRHSGRDKWRGGRALLNPVL
jgi:cold-inducible RNA-binding protein